MVGDIQRYNVDPANLMRDSKAVQESYKQTLGDFGTQVKGLAESVKQEITQPFSEYLSAVRRGDVKALNSAKEQMEQVLQSHNAPDTAVLALQNWHQDGASVAWKYSTQSYGAASSLTYTAQEDKTAQAPTEEVAVPQKQGFFQRLFKKPEAAQNAAQTEQQPRNSRGQEYSSESLPPPVVNDKTPQHEVSNGI